jgi:hypothetical protein
MEEGVKKRLRRLANASYGRRPTCPASRYVHQHEKFTWRSCRDAYSRQVAAFRKIIRTIG